MQNHDVHKEKKRNKRTQYRNKKTKLEVVKEYKYLGVIFDSKLTWKANTEYLVAKANKKAWILKYMANKYNIPQKTLLIMYETIIVPIITYGIEIWGDVCITHFKKLESVEHSCITKILGVNRLAHKTDTMYEAKMIPLK